MPRRTTATPGPPGSASGRASPCAAALEAGRETSLRGIRRWCWLVAVLPATATAEIANSSDPDTGLRSWRWHESGVSIEFMQRLPDQNRAFFLARGFGRAAADRIAEACVMQTIFRNDGGVPVDYNLDDWRIHQGGAPRRLLTRERWRDIWRHGETSEAARIAQHWALLPTRQRFEPGDYNWGMTSFGLPPGAGFDLELVVTLAGEPVIRRVAGVVCADDRPGAAP